VSVLKNYEVVIDPFLVCDETDATIHSTVLSLIEEGAIVFTIREVEEVKP
jgi:hypothetical protein